MGTNSGARPSSSGYELVFVPYRPGFHFAFPCSALGVVDLDALTDKLRNDYLLARTLVGRDFGAPQVVPQLA
jgi:hypothetical protein